MSLTLEPLTSIARFYPAGAQFGDAHRACVVVNHDFRDRVTLEAGTGRLTRRDMLELGERLYADGVRVVRAWRANGHRLPGAHIVAQSEHYTCWELQLEEALRRVRGGA